MITKIIYSLAVVLSLVFSTQSQQNKKGLCELVVNVENIKSLEGNLKFGVYNNRDSFLKSALTWGEKSIDTSTTTITFSGLKKGTYAISIFHDKNNNGKLDMNFIGIPVESYAFSNNTKGLFGPPSFYDCQFEVLEDRHEITIHF